MELRNALYLKVFRGDLTAGEAEEQEAHFEWRMARGFYYRPEIRRPALLAEFRRWAQRTGTLDCRTMDLLHMVCALQLEVDGHKRRWVFRGRWTSTHWFSRLHSCSRTEKCASFLKYNLR